MDIFLALLLGYAFGSIPFGLLLTKMAGLGDVRQQGSGNIGATNVLRTGNKGLAAATLLLDLAKGFVPVYLAWQWFPDLIGFAAVGAILGHCFPIWLGFKGGKGVATLAGVCFGIGWPVGLAYALVWLAMLAITRISSLSGITAAIIAPAVAWFGGNYVQGTQQAVPFLALIAVLILWLHRSNIGRLRAGTEPKVGSK